MSRENVEIAKRALRAWTERDENAMETLFHPDFEYRGLAEWPGLPRGYRGGAESLRRQSHVDAELDEFRAELLEAIDAGERVVFVLEMTAIGKQSRVPVRFTEASVVTIRDRQVARIEVCGTREKALEVCGLSE